MGFGGALVADQLEQRAEEGLPLRERGRAEQERAGVGAAVRASVGVRARRRLQVPSERGRGDEGITTPSFGSSKIAYVVGFIGPSTAMSASSASSLASPS